MLTSAQPIWLGWGSEPHLLLQRCLQGPSSAASIHGPWDGRPRKSGARFGPTSGPCSRPPWAASRVPMWRSNSSSWSANGYPEETYYNLFRTARISEDDGRPGGIICANHGRYQAGHRGAPTSPCCATCPPRPPIRVRGARCASVPRRRSAANPHDSALCHDLHGRVRSGAPCRWWGSAGIAAGHPAAPANHPIGQCRAVAF